MKQNYPAPPDGVNPQPSPELGYFAHIPAPVLWSEKLSPAAKLFYGGISSLCNVSGFCWATNEWFVAQYQVDEATIRRWIAALEKEGFVRVVREKGTSYRRIYLAEADALNLVKPAQKRTEVSAKMREPSRKNAPHNIKENIKESIKETLNVVGGGRSRFVEPGPTSACELKTQEQKGPSATAIKSPPAASPLPWKQQKINEVVAATGDEKSRLRFKQLLDVCDGASALDAWQDALDALKRAESGAAGLVERPGAYFASVLVSSLNDRGVAVPVGKPSERRSVKSAIAASFAAAGAAVGVDVVAPALGAGEGGRL